MIFPANTGRAFVPIMSLNGLTGKLAGRFQSTLPVQGATTQIFPIFLANRFQSTLPVRGATMAASPANETDGFQSTLPVRGATPQRGNHVQNAAISIHAPRTGSDILFSGGNINGAIFQSTLPVRGATRFFTQIIKGFLISIHAPRTGSDYQGNGRYPGCLHFNPRSPYGERRLSLPREARPSLFQSTLPVRGATSTSMPTERFVKISIHAPRTGSDSYKSTNPLSVAGISIHAPRTGSDPELIEAIPVIVEFQSTLPVRGATSTAYRTFWRKIFQSTLPVRGATELRKQIAAIVSISIHAPRTGSDELRKQIAAIVSISIHAPRTGSDSKNSQKVTLFLRQLNNFPKYHLGFPFLSRPTAFFSRKSVKKRSAKSPVFLVRLPFASKQSAHPQEHRRPSPQNARFCFHSGFQDSKTAGCPSPGP